MLRSTEEEGLDITTIGKLRYRNGDYHGALIAFNEVAKHCTGPLLLAALDHRAATYEKLKDLKSALRDSKQIIDLKPDGAKGYLRCGKVLRLRGERDLALKIYERGLTKVKPGTDPDRAHLNKIYEAVSSTSKTLKCFNPLAMLPLELAQMVCNYLDLCDKISCLRVHSSWKKFFDDTCELWDYLDTSTVKRPITENALKIHLRRSHFNLRSAKIRVMATGFNSPKMRYLTRTCQKLEFLEIQQGQIGETLLSSLPLAKSLRTLVLSASARITLASVVKTMSMLPLLKVAEFHNVDPGEFAYSCNWPELSSLEQLVLIAAPRTASEIGYMGLDNLKTKTPNMKCFRLVGWGSRVVAVTHTSHGFSSWSVLEELDLCGTQLYRISTLPASLRILNLSGMWKLRHLSYAPEADGRDPVLPLLNEFSCSETPFVTIQGAFAALRASITNNNLKKLDLGGLSAYEPDHFIASEKLEEISLSRCQEKEEVILSILSKYPRLKRVDLSNTKITGITIKELMTKSGGSVEWLNLNECHKVSPDGVEYARGKGCHVERKFTAPVRSYRDSFV